MSNFALNRRVTLAGGLALAASRALAQADPAPAQNGPLAPTSPAPPPSLGRIVRVDLKTADGPIVLELYPDRAPITVANFLHYVRSRRFDGIAFYRAVRTPGAADMGFIQAGIQDDARRLFPPIAHEPTTQTGLRHRDGTITMARGKPGSATSDFVIMVGEASYMDAHPDAPNPPGGDNLGYAAFGQVVEGMDVVKKILAAPTGGHARNPVMQGQILDPPVKIIAARIEP